jgi:hypothetical protein
MYQVSFTLPLEENVIKTLPAGTYRITVTGLSDASDVVSVEPRDAGDTAWGTAVTFGRTDSGKIGSKTVTVTASRKLRCSISGEVQPTSVKVRISA